MSVIDEAFGKLFPGKAPLVWGPWVKAGIILDNFNVSTFGEVLALAVLCNIVNYISFPTQEMTTYLTKRAAEKIPEILGLNSYHKLHADEIAHIQIYLERGESIPEIKARWRSEKA